MSERGKAKFSWKSTIYRGQVLEPYFFVLPALTYMAVLIGYSLVYNVILSFQNVSATNLSKKHEFIGFQNYITLFSEYSMGKILGQTLFFTLISIFLQFFLGLALAVFFNNSYRVAEIARGAMMVSYVLPVVATALLFQYMFSSDSGIIDKILISAGMIKEPLSLLTSTKSVLWAPIIAATWQQAPYNMLLLLTGIISIPGELNESASIDGANFFQRLLYITIPLLSKTMLAVLTIGFLNTFKVFDLIFTMTGGGPLGASEVLSTLSYNLSFLKFKFSLGAATANILFAFLLIIALFYNLLIKKEES